MVADRRTELVHRVRYSGEIDLAFAVIDAVATISDSPPDEIGPLNDVLDPEALCELFGPTADGRVRLGGTISFELDGYRIAVDAAENEIEIYE